MISPLLAALIESPDGGNWVLEVEGSAPATVHSGEAMVIPRGVRHRFHMERPSVMRSTFVFVSFDGQAGADLLAPARIPYILPPAVGRRLVRLMDRFRELHAAIAGGDFAALAARYRAGFALLEELLRHAAVRQSPPENPDLARLMPALRYVADNLGKPLSVPELARRAALSPSRFHFVFKRALGVAPVAYIQQARLRLAQHLLLTTGDRIGGVAAKAGFDSAYYFCRVFRRRLHTTPAQFRRDFSRYRPA